MSNEFSRRRFLLTTASLLAAGCAQQAGMSERMGPAWPDVPMDARPRPTGDGYSVPAPRQAYVPPPTPVAPVVSSGFQAIPRNQWTRTGPILKNINPMGGVDRITVHHEGWKQVWYTDFASTAAAIERDRRAHVDDRRWGDIGYHYIIDRAGRVWQGRDVRYQGAHVEANNEHNIGVMVLGNFDLQSPTDAQVGALRNTLSHLMKTYRVPARRVYSHREIRPTACPGRNLQPKFAYLRQSGLA